MDEGAPARQVPVVQGQRQVAAVHQSAVRPVQALRRVRPPGMEGMTMPHLCRTHCPQDGGGLAAAVTVLAGVVGAALALSVILPVVEALTWTILGMCAAGTLVVARLIKYGDRREVFRRHRAPAPPLARDPQPQRAITAGQKAIEGKIVPGWSWRELHDAAKEEAR